MSPAQQSQKSKVQLLQLSFTTAKYTMSAHEPGIDHAIVSMSWGTMQISLQSCKYRFSWYRYFYRFTHLYPLQDLVRLVFRIATSWVHIEWSTYSAKPSGFDVCFDSLSGWLVHYFEMKMFNFKNFVLKLVITLSLRSYMMLCWHGKP